MDSDVDFEDEEALLRVLCCEVGEDFWLAERRYSDVALREDVASHVEAKA